MISPTAGATYYASSTSAARVTVTSPSAFHKVELYGPYTGSISYSLAIAAGIGNNQLAPFVGGEEDWTSYTGSASVNLLTSSHKFEFGASCSNVAAFSKQTTSYTGKAWATAHLTYTGAPTHNPDKQEVTFTISPN